MKLKQVIFPVALALLAAGSVFYLSDSRSGSDFEYESLLAKAREETEEKVYVDAAADYKTLMNLRPSLELAIEAGEMYIAADDYDHALSWYQSRMANAYYNDPRTYLFGIQMAIGQEDYGNAFSFYETYCKRDFRSKEVEDLMEPYLYTYSEGYDYVDAGSFCNSSGYAPVMTADQWCFIDSSGKQTTASDYVKVGMMRSDYGPVVTDDGVACYVDPRGNLKIPTAYFEKRNPGVGKIEEFKDVQSGLVLARSGDEWMYFDLNTRMLRFGGFKDATVITDGAGAVSMDGEKWALFSTEGSPLTDFIYDEVVVNDKGIACVGGVLFVRQGDGYHLVNTSGQPVNKSVYSEVCAFNEPTLAAAKKDGAWLFVDIEGNEINLGDYNGAYSFSNGVAAVRIGRQWGYIDTAGKMVVDPLFDDLKPMSAQGMTFGKTDMGWTLLSFYKYKYDLAQRAEMDNQG